MKISKYIKNSMVSSKINHRKNKNERDLKKRNRTIGGMVTHPSPIKTQKIIYFPSPRAAIAATALES